MAKPQTPLKALAVAYGLLGVILCCCSGSVPAILAEPTPTVPANLATLPAKGRIATGRIATCDGGTSLLFELPGLPTEDTSHTGNMGKIVGSVRDCDPVTVVDVAWSEENFRFYVLIEVPGGKGWISADAVEVPYP
jgi:hypothetical protein